MTFQNTTILSGTFVDLEPLHESHREELKEISQDASISIYSPQTLLGNQFQRWFDKALIDMQAGKALAFAVRRKSDNKIIGSTRYYDIVSDHKRLTIGYTWYTQEARGTAVNPECKLLLLQNAFESLQFNRVELFTDSRNLHSRAAIKKLGAIEEGLLRQHIICHDGYVRDTVVFSIIKSQWPEIQKNLKIRLKI